MSEDTGTQWWRIRLRPPGQPLPPPIAGLPEDAWPRIYGLARWRERVGALTDFPGYKTCEQAGWGEATNRMRFARILYRRGYLDEWRTE